MKIIMQAGADLTVQARAAQFSLSLHPNGPPEDGNRIGRHLVTEVSAELPDGSRRRYVIKWNKQSITVYPQEPA